MREILFRGKSCIGNWVYGYLKKQMVGDKADVWSIQTEGKEMLHLPATRFKPAKDTLLYENIVAPNTVGQFTGLTDKNGKKIFEGDIVHIDNYDEGWDSVVEFNGGAFAVDVEGRDYDYTAIGWTEYQSIIIGNIHDNPELAKEDSE